MNQNAHWRVAAFKANTGEIEYGLATTEEQFRTYPVCSNFIEWVGISDHVDNDGTDFAHPAFVRGTDFAFQTMLGKVEEILDGKDSGAGVANEPWETARRRLIKLVTARERVLTLCDLAFCHDPMGMDALLDLERKIKVAYGLEPDESIHAAEANHAGTAAKEYHDLVANNPHVTFINGHVQLNLDDDLVNILGRPNFTCAALAHILDQAGISKLAQHRSENEQASAIHFMLNHYLRFGPRWLEEAQKALDNIEVILKEKQNANNDNQG